MPTLTPNQALDQFVQLAETQCLESLNGMVAKDIKKLFKGLLKEVIPDRTFTYILQPTDYLANFAETMRNNQLPSTALVSAGLADRFETMDELSKAYFSSLVIYFVQCAVHESIKEKDLEADLNYFTKTFNSEKLIKGPFKKIPSTYFGTRQLGLFELTLPATNDFLVVYNKHGVLTSLMYYQGKGFINYEPGSVITDFFAK